MNELPIKNLCCVVIQTAYKDALRNKSKADQKSALDFIMTNQLDKFIAYWQLDLAADAIRTKLKKELEKKGHDSKT